MAQSGPKRKDVPREPNGRPQRPNKRPSTMAALNAMERDRQDEVMAVAKSQPHRREFAWMTKKTDLQSRMMESASGRFLLRNMQDERRQEIYFETGLAYAALVGRWKAAWGAQASNPPPESLGSGEGPSAAAVAGWKRKIETIKGRLLREGSPEVLMWTGLLLIDNLDVPGADVPQVLNGLWIIATEMGKLDIRLNKVA